MTPQLRDLLILLGGIAVVLVIIIILFSGKSRFRRILSIFLEETGEAEDAPPERRPANGSREPHAPEFVQKSTNEPVVVMATLIRKSDDRLRIIESTGQVRLEDEYYELIFVTRKGQKLKIECSAEAYDKIPFNQQGSLTYKRNTLVKFKYYEDTVLNY